MTKEQFRRIWEHGFDAGYEGIMDHGKWETVLKDFPKEWFALEEIMLAEAKLTEEWEARLEEQWRRL
jgi:hypothetical protein